MESFQNAYRLYGSFTKTRKEDLLKIVASPHPDQFKVSEQTGIYYKELYIDQINKDTKEELLSPPDDETCKSCKSHFLIKRPKIDHSTDLKIGGILEDEFKRYINYIFNKQNMPLNCVRADTNQKNMPDFKIINKISKEAIFYFEFKCIFKPFIKVGKEIPNAFCYSHSMTLDCDQKLEKQKNLILENKLLSKSAYVYWYDIPCIKGVFWKFSDEVYKYQKNAETYSRKTQTGDYNDGARTGHIKKLYLPLHQMKNLDSLLEHIRTLV